MIGISIRYAIAVGMHVRNDDPSASPEKKDILAQTWWGLHSVECLLSSMTGRPYVLSDEHCTVPLPGLLNGNFTSHSATFRTRGNVQNCAPTEILVGGMYPIFVLDSWSKNAAIETCHDSFVFQILCSLTDVL